VGRIEVKRILLIGNDGQVGYELQRTLAPLGQVTAVRYPEIDFAVPDAVRQIVRANRPELIVNAAAYTAVDKAESEPDLCRKINAGGPALLAEEAKRLGAGLIHYSTDFVFDGARHVPYTEEDTPHPLGVYAQTKLEGDQAIMASGAPHLIFRLAWVYAARGKNFLLTIQRLAREGKPLRVVDDQVGCPTWSRPVAEATAAALARIEGFQPASGPGALSPDPQGAPFSFQEVSGLYNAVCAGETSWWGFARAFIPPEIPIQRIATADYPTPARRPVYSVLTCDKLRRVFGVTMPAWPEALHACLEDTRQGSSLSLKGRGAG
jgi:dTDP-4-dehydrorhamnose reductase